MVSAYYEEVTQLLLKQPLLGRLAKIVARS